MHDAEPVVLLVEFHHGDELVLVDDVSIENLQLPVRHCLAIDRCEELMGNLRVGIVTPCSRMPLRWRVFRLQ